MATADESFYLSANTQNIDYIYEDYSDVDRSGNLLKSTSSDFGKNYSPHNDKQQATNFAPKDDFQFSTFTFGELKLCVLHLCTNASAESLWNAVERFFDESPCVDTEVHSQSKVIYGNYYQNPQNCSFLAEVGELEDGEQRVLSVRRLGGDAFALTGLFEKLKTYLESEDFDFEEDENSESEVDSDDEEYFEKLEENDEILDDFEEDTCEIDFQYDPELLNMMINDFETSYLDNKNYTMSIFAHASESKQNRDFMLKGQWLEKIKKLICKQLENGKDFGDATLTRNTCVFLKNLLEDMEIDRETLVCVVKAMSEWCPGQKDCGRQIGYLHSSRQVMVEADQIFAKIVENSIFSDEDVEEIITTNLTCTELKQVEDFASDCCLEFQSFVLYQFQV